MDSKNYRNEARQLINGADPIRAGYQEPEDVALIGLVMEIRDTLTDLRKASQPIQATINAGAAPLPSQINKEEVAPAAGSLSDDRPMAFVFRSKDDSRWVVDIDTSGSEGPVAVYLNDSVLFDRDPERPGRTGVVVNTPQGDTVFDQATHWGEDGGLLVVYRYNECLATYRDWFGARFAVVDGGDVR